MVTYFSGHKLLLINNSLIFIFTFWYKASTGLCEKCRGNKINFHAFVMPQNKNLYRVIGYGTEALGVQ